MDTQRQCCSIPELSNPSSSFPLPSVALFLCLLRTSRRGLRLQVLTSHTRMSIGRLPTTTATPSSTSRRLRVKVSVLLHPSRRRLTHFGSEFLDASFSKDFDGASSVNIIPGPYHFAIPSESTGTQQANFFLENYRRHIYGDTLPGALYIQCGGCLSSIFRIH